jgi:hypothetical protein
MLIAAECRQLRYSEVGWKGSLTAAALSVVGISRQYITNSMTLLPFYGSLGPKGKKKKRLG